MKTAERIEQMLGTMKAYNSSMGLDNRCTTCGAGVQKWCFDPIESAAHPKATIGTYDLRHADGSRSSHTKRLAAVR